MTQKVIDFYHFDSLWLIMKGEEKRGKLRADFYSSEVKEISRVLKSLRSQLRSSPKEERDSLQQDIQDLKYEMDERKKEELKQKALEINRGKAKLKIKSLTIKGHGAFASNNLDTVLVSQIVKLELKRCYRLYPANRDVIIEQIKGLLNNGMSKIVIRADICSFFESIPQQGLVSKLADDGFVSKKTVKYLKGLFYAYNDKADNKEGMGLPRGLSFSSHLAELFMRPIDEKIKQTEGVYYYKRYVDDILIVADPAKGDKEHYWNVVNGVFKESGLALHNDSEKKYIACWDGTTTEKEFDYLGYKFVYRKGKLDVCLSQKRYQKYKTLIDAIFEIYAQCSHYRRRVDTRGQEVPRRDALHQLFDRLETLTSNGLLSGRKNFVATGVYYSNKHLTNLKQLEDLDAYLAKTIDSKETFCPPANLFDYGKDNGYEKNVDLIVSKLHDFSFARGFRERRIHKDNRYGRVLLDLQRIYYSRKDREDE